jgi:hypothetical protein
LKLAPWRLCHRVALGLVVALGLGSVGCDDEPSRAGAPGAKGTSPAGATSATVEGAPTIEVLFARAQRAVDEGDDRAFVLSIRPETRDLWLRDLVVDVAVESSDQPIDADRDRTRRAKFRRVLAAFGARLSERPSSLTRLGDSLLERVRDREGLFAALLELARVEGSPYDPVRALTSGSATSSTCLPIVRLVERVRSPATITTEAAAPSASASASAPASASSSAPPAAPPSLRPLVAGPSVVFVTAAGGALPLRLWSDGTSVWLDES